jgi:hypothetical protein
MRLRRVGEHHLVTARAVGEEVEDAFLLHQPADEGEIGLVVLRDASRRG